MKHKNFLKNTAKFLVLAMLLTLSPVFAQTISAALVNTKVFVNGEQIELKDAKGNDLQPINYNGSIYLPVRSISKAFNQPIEYDAKNNAVKIGKEQKDDKPFYLLKDWSLLKDSYGLKKESSFEDGNGKTYDKDHAVTFDYPEPRLSYDAKSRYTKLTGTIASKKEAEIDYSEMKIKIEGDGKELFVQQIGVDSMPVDFEVNLTGVQTLKIYIYGGSGRLSDFFLADLALWK